MFSQSADEPAVDQSPAPIGMRELPPQPAKPVMPAYVSATPETAPQAVRSGPGPDDSVIAKDDHLEGTFTSRGTVVVMGSVKGRIEAVQVRIEDGAHVDADVIVDEAIIAGEFTGNLTCRERLEARASGRISGRVETFKLMLHEGASVEGEMHMLTGSPKDASETIRGTAPLRGEAKSEAAGEARAGMPAASGSTATPLQRTSSSPGASSSPGTSSSPSASPSPGTKASPSAKAETAVSATAASPSDPTPAPAASVEASRVRSSVAETLRAETLAMRVAPRASTASRGYGSSGRSTASGSRNGTTTTGF
ncbi:MAG TPA: polymer-forming cytoskeletal protein [Anaerolineae bacterium]|nr:polymer-forming cytoskeletal protein [Anaerolineae bacterium]